MRLPARVVHIWGQAVSDIYIVIDDDGAYRTRTRHRIQRYQCHPVSASPWDDKVFALDGDVLPGNHIELVEVPADPFATEGGPVVVPTIAQTTAILAAYPDQGHLLPLTAGAQDTEEVHSRHFFQLCCSSGD